MATVFKSRSLPDELVKRLVAIAEGYSASHGVMLSDSQVIEMLAAYYEKHELNKEKQAG